MISGAGNTSTQELTRTDTKPIFKKEGHLFRFGTGGLNGYESTLSMESSSMKEKNRNKEGNNARRKEGI